MPATLLISDANVIIDMEVGGLIERMFELDYVFAVPDVLYEEELRNNHPDLLTLGLKQIELQAKAVDDAVRLAAKYVKPGRIDLMALALARQEHCRLLTGDLALREASIAEDIEVVGTIWLVGELLSAKVVTRKDARVAYREMKESGRRLPWTEADAQLGITGQ